MIDKVLKSIFRNNDLMMISDSFIKGIATFEEIPIFLRDREIEELKKFNKPEKIFPLLIKTSLYLGYIVSINNQINRNDFFISITLLDLEKDLNEFGYVIPNIFILNKKNVSAFNIRKNGVELDDKSIYNVRLKEIIGDNNLRLYKTHSVDGFGGIDRIHIVLD